MGAQPQERTTLRRSLSVWQAVGISVALMAPSMAANINPQGTTGQVGRATPLAFFLAAVAVLLIAYVFVRLCEHYRHSGSVYVFAGATLRERAGAVAGFGLMGTYVFYALVTSSAAGIIGSAFLESLGIWTDQPEWAGFLVGGVALLLALTLAVACVVGASRLLFAISRDLAPGSALARTGSSSTPATAAGVVAAVVALIAVVCALAFGAKPFDTFLWSGTIGTLILLVAYVLATVGCIKLIWVDHKMSVPGWQVFIPIGALVMLVYTLYRNVFPYPDEGPPRWFPVVAFGWLLLVTVIVLVVPGLAHRMSAAFAHLDEDAA
jgi:amino acid transporter